ncbi:MAG: sigma-70 family RNA polymerase sigma factor [Bacteroidota bacterium]
MAPSSNPPKPIIELLEQHQALIYKVVNAYCTDRHEQEDLIQEILFLLLKSYDRFDHQVKVTTWMYRIALNVSISHYRNIQKRQRYNLPMPEKLVEVVDAPAKDMQEEVQRLHTFIQTLKPLNRALMILYLDGNSHAEMAAALGISVSNVGTRINRIKKQLQQKLKNA